MPSILVIYGTRPEAIKMAPVVAELGRSAHMRPIVAVTGQHREMLDQVNGMFGIVPHFDLDIITPGQTLEDITTKALTGLAEVIRSVSPDIVLVQGDTTTCFVAALAAFYAKASVVHLEAGLRTAQRYNPFPEEINRRLTSQLADLHLAPTARARANLVHDGIDARAIHVTGNTVIDALLHVAAQDHPVRDPRLSAIRGRRMVLVTTHRRESWGAPMVRTANAIARLAKCHPDIVFFIPAHLNPTVRDALLPPLRALENVVISEPLVYSDMAWALRTSNLVLTDSGGIQEEAPSLGKPVLVLRETTERPEAVDAGTVRLVGTDEDVIVESVTQLLTDEVEYARMARAVNPYGDGQAARRSVQAIEHFTGFAARPEDFTPAVMAP